MGEQPHFCLCDFVIENYKQMSTFKKKPTGQGCDNMYLEDSISEVGGCYELNCVPSPKFIC